MAEIDLKNARGEVFGNASLGKRSGVMAAPKTDPAAVLKALAQTEVGHEKTTVSVANLFNVLAKK